MFGRTGYILARPLANARLKGFSLFVNCDVLDDIGIDAHIHVEISLTCADPYAVQFSGGRDCL